MPASTVITANDRLRDAAIRRAVDMEAYKQGLFVRILDGIEGPGFERVIADTYRQVARMNRLSVRQLQGARGQEILANLLQSNRETLRLAYRAARDLARQELTEFAFSEAQWMRAAIRTAMPVVVDFSAPGRSALRQMVQRQPHHGKLIAEWFEKLGEDAHDRIGQTIRIGLAQGRSVDQITRSLGGTKANGYADGAVQAPRRHLQTTVRTIATDVSAQARQETMKESDVVSAWQFVATLDLRTSSECAGTDGRVFEVGTGPMPPLHPDCRSQAIPVLKSWKALGIDLKEAPESTRAQLPGSKGTATESTTYGTWLSRQSKEWQDQALGPTRAELFRTGQVKIDRFVDYSSVPPRKFTLEELAKREGIQISGVKSD